MKKIYTLLVTLFITYGVWSQTYNLGITHNSGTNFSVLAYPNFTTSDADISDVGFTLLLPTGASEIQNETLFNGRAWTIIKAPGSALGVDPTKDLFVFNMPSGQSTIGHTANVPFVLVTFDIANAPTTGTLDLLDNADDIATTIAPIADSFFNSNPNGTGITNNFDSIEPGQGSFSFDTLSTTDIDLEVNAVSVYPNPTKDVMTIKTTNNTELQSVDVYDMNGRLVLSNPRGVNLIDMTGLTTGMYFATISTANYSKQIKIIKN